MTARSAYLELSFTQAVQSCVQAVSATVAYHSSAAQQTTAKTSIFDGSTEQVVEALLGGDARLSEDQLKRIADLVAKAGINYYCDWGFDDQPFPMETIVLSVLKAPYVVLPARLPST